VSDGGKSRLGARPRRLLKIAALAAAYVCAARLGLMMDALGGLATLVWPPTGIALASLLLFGLELWPGVALGAFVVNHWVGAPWSLCGIIALGNTLEAVLAAYTLLRLRDFSPELTNLKSAAYLLLLAIVSTLVSATLGVGGMALNHALPPSGFWLTWQVWWIGDFIGDLVVAPLLLSWWSRSKLNQKPRWLEIAALTVGLLASLWLIFGALPATHAPWLRQAYLLIPLLLWAAVRFGPRGASAATLLASAGAIWGTALGHGPFVHATLHEGLLTLQTFMSIVAVTYLILGAVVAERAELFERERMARTDAERAVRIRDDFLVVASHELRTPLTPLQLQLEGVQRAAESGDPRLAERVKQAIAQSGRLTQLVDSLLDVSRLASGRFELALEECDMAEIVAGAVERSRERAARAGSALRLAASGPLPGRWDRVRAEQLVFQLLSNAVKYGRGGAIDVELAATPRGVEITVRDVGIGIPPEALTRIFERFERATSGRQYDGLGLGLYVAQQIALAHQGDIRVASELGVGSTFTVRLPYDPSSA
jgi:signal transduction histidine kinase